MIEEFVVSDLTLSLCSIKESTNRISFTRLAWKLIEIQQATPPGAMWNLEAFRPETSESLLELEVSLLLWLNCVKYE